MSSCPHCSPSCSRPLCFLTLSVLSILSSLFSDSHPSSRSLTHTHSYLLLYPLSSSSSPSPRRPACRACSTSSSYPPLGRCVPFLCFVDLLCSVLSLPCSSFDCSAFCIFAGLATSAWLSLSLLSIPPGCGVRVGLTRGDAVSLLRPPSISALSKTSKPAAAGLIEDEPEEALKAGALYAECAVVRMRVPPPPVSSSAGEKDEGKDGDEADLGGERAGRAVWEAYEAGLRGWEARAKARGEEKEEKSAGAASTGKTEGGEGTRTS
ncbi:hypothetical protein MSAN_00825400 [Mycena sanguinolenta]|uniref:Uncharacterized protein n=1 Tax=Mycena sanguinolenta TaxID=230812 RepID=A0A8H6YYI6_9AGAR|nr:hypothetical protein MSAN_00825400 [Mycena sanguinolenta]